MILTQKEIHKLRERYIKEGYKLAFKKMNSLNESWKTDALEKDGWIPIDQYKYTPNESGYRQIVKSCEGKDGKTIKAGNYIQFDYKGSPSKKAKVIAVYEIDPDTVSWLSKETTHEIVALWTITADKTKFVKQITVENSKAWRVISTKKPEENPEIEVKKKKK